MSNIKTYAKINIIPNEKISKSSIKINRPQQSIFKMPRCKGVYIKFRDISSCNRWEIYIDV